MTKLITVKGAVQGVGYRPFIAEKATEYHLVGNVKNIGAAVEILVSGTESDIASFLCCKSTRSCKHILWRPLSLMLLAYSFPIDV